MKKEKEYTIARKSAGVQPWWIQGNSKGGQSQRLGKDYLIRKERLGKNSVVGKLVEKRG